MRWLKYRNSHTILIQADKQLDHFQKPGNYSITLKQTILPAGDYILKVETVAAQVLCPIFKADDVGGSFYYRTYSRYFKRFNSWLDLKDNQRVWVEHYLDAFIAPLQAQLDPAALNLGVITDTHDKAGENKTYYGTNGWRHVQELNYLAQSGSVDLKVHLGDMIDGSDAPEISQNHLQKIITTLSAGKIPFVALRGNHDDNDKYDERHGFKPSFTQCTFQNIVQRPIAVQPQVHVSKIDPNVSYFDKGNMRVLFINTCDIPYLYHHNGHKVYDMKLNMGIRQKQFQAIIQILENSQDKTLLVCGHADIITVQRKTAVKYNGKTLHELMAAYNRHQKGWIHTNHRQEAFQVNLPFDFKQHQGKIAAYICGHKHTEADYKLDGIQYVLLNCSALMGKYHQLTTKYNRHWDRHQGDITEFAGYLISLDTTKRQLRLFGYGAASQLRLFHF